MVIYGVCTVGHWALYMGHWALYSGPLAQGPGMTPMEPLRASQMNTWGSGGPQTPLSILFIRRGPIYRLDPKPACGGVPLLIPPFQLDSLGKGPPAGPLRGGLEARLPNESTTMLAGPMRGPL